jgi:hypothetical protein
VDAMLLKWSLLLQSKELKTTNVSNWASAWASIDACMNLTKHSFGKFCMCEAASTSELDGEDGHHAMRVCEWWIDFEFDSVREVRVELRFYISTDNLCLDRMQRACNQSSRSYFA